MIKNSTITQIVFAAALLVGLTVKPFPASASIITFDLSYSGAALGNSAIGTGFISFDDTVLPNIAVHEANVFPATLGIVNFSITISGASSGNGTFGLSDFAGLPDGWVWDLAGPLNLSANLVGQANFNDFNWCAFSISCGSSTAPGGVGTFTIATAGETGNSLVLTSMSPTSPTPLPAALPLFATGLGAFGLLGWRRKRKVQANA